MLASLGVAFLPFVSIPKREKKMNGCQPSNVSATSVDLVRLVASLFIIWRFLAPSVSCLYPLTLASTSLPFVFSAYSRAAVCLSDIIYLVANKLIDVISRNFRMVFHPEIT